jgi:AbiV family abortive infection protein
MQQYRGQLTNEEIAEGYNLAVRNAKRLADDAESLLSRGRYLSAITLAILAIEEEGKTGLFTVLALAESNEEVREFWKSYRRHTAKNRHLSFLKAYGQNVGVYTATEEALGNDSEAAGIDSLKQLSIYTDCLREKEWHSPDMIPLEYQQQLATGLVSICGHFSYCEIAKEQLEVYAQHLIRVKGASQEIAEHALVECLKELQSRGMIPSRANNDEFLVELICGSSPTSNMPTHSAAPGRSQ